MFTNSLLERTVIRVLCFLLGGWTALSALQLAIVYNFTTYSFWFDLQKFSPDACIVNIFILMQASIGIALLISKIWHKYRLILWSLGFMWTFHLILAMVSGWIFKLQSSSFMPYLMIGLVSALLWAYYKNRDDNTEQDKELLL